MSTYAVRYLYDDRDDLRASVRPEHRAYLTGLADAGQLLGSGPFTDDEPAGALLVLVAPDRSALDALLAGDPFAAAGLIAATDVRLWDVATGPWAASTH
jgi:uncharacterized protein YciI